MRFREVVTLIDLQVGKDADGYDLPAEETRTEVFADLQSVKRSEYYSSRQAGVELALAFLVRACDYAGQRYLECDGKRYKVERVYSKDGELNELNCSEVRGTKA